MTAGVNAVLLPSRLDFIPIVEGALAGCFAGFGVACRAVRGRAQVRHCDRRW